MTRLVSTTASMVMELATTSNSLQSDQGYCLEQKLGRKLLLQHLMVVVSVVFAVDLDSKCIKTNGMSITYFACCNVAQVNACQ